MLKASSKEATERKLGQTDAKERKYEAGRRKSACSSGSMDRSRNQNKATAAVRLMRSIL